MTEWLSRNGSWFNNTDLVCMHANANAQGKNSNSYNTKYVSLLLAGPELPGFLLQPFRKPKRIRTAFSPSQLLKLEHAFERNHYVVGAERKQLANNLSLTETQVSLRLSLSFVTLIKNTDSKIKKLKQGRPCCIEIAHSTLHEVSLICPN